jgi:hydroxymethylbilane synthase
LREDINVHFLRGNVNTRLQKLAQGEFDAIILAAAGLERLGLAVHIRHTFSANDMLPAVSQGVLGIECRSEDKQTQQLLAPLHHADTAACVLAERALCRRLDAGCHAPVAAYAEWRAASQILTLRGLVASPDGKTVLRVTQVGAYQEAEALGKSVAEALLAAGAGPLLAEPV